jgi:hypothetical protein
MHRIYSIFFAMHRSVKNAMVWKVKNDYPKYINKSFGNFCVWCTVWFFENTKYIMQSKAISFVFNQQILFGFTDSLHENICKW